MNAVSLRRQAPRLLGLLLVALLAMVASSAPAAAAACPSSINEALVVSEVGGTEEVPPGQLDRPFPDIPELLVPGGREKDALRIRSIAEVPVEASLIVAPGDTSVIDPEHDLHVRITWGDAVLAEGSYRDVVGQRFSLGTLTPRQIETLRVEVELPWIDDWNNDTQDRRWPLRFNLGVASDCDAESDTKADAEDSTKADANANSDDRADANDSSRASTRSDARASSASDSRASANGSSSSGEDTSANDSGSADGRGDLPRTGFTAGLLIVIAGAAVVLGLVLVVFVRSGRRQ